MAALILNIGESLSIKEERRGNFVGTISDIYVQPADLTEAQFAELLSSIGAVGYENFRNYISGDYDYRYAMFKNILRTNGGIPRLNDLDVYIDVPDIFDRGTATTLSTDVVVVSFNRTFTAVPEVNATLKGGTVIAAPRITSVTETNFTLELVNVAGARVAGTVSWSARGY